MEEIKIGDTFEFKGIKFIITGKGKIGIRAKRVKDDKKNG